MKRSFGGKRLAFIGSVGYNLGDEAIAVAAANYMLSVDPELRIRIGSVKRGVIDKYENLEEFTLSKRSLAGWRELVEIVKSTDVVVLGGGTLVQDKLGISLLRGMLASLFQIVCVARMFGKPIVTLPLGVDEVNTRLGRLFARYVLNAAEHLTVRDSVSRRLASAYGGIESAKIEVCADPAFLIGDLVGEEANAKVSEFRGRDFPLRYLAVSLANDHPVNDRHLGALVGVFRWVLKVTDLGFIFVPMERREKEERKLFKIIVERLGGEYGDRLRVLSPDMSLFAIADVIRRAELLIAMRLHAMILGVGYVPIVGISRTTKTDTFLDEFGLPHINLEHLVDAEHLVSLVREVLFDNEQEHLLWFAREMRKERTHSARRGLEDLVSSVAKLLGRRSQGDK